MRICIKKALILAVSATIFTATAAQENLSALIPMPNKIEAVKSDNFRIAKVKSIHSNLPADAFCLRELRRIIKERTGIILPENNQGNGCSIKIKTDSSIIEKERYILEVSKKNITITGANEGAIFYALQTLDQLLLGDTPNTRNGEIAAIKIDDAPRYAYRAVMLDPARHFLPVEDVKFFIDRMAKYKFNKLQLHLTDDQGWRIEIKSHPELTKAGAFRNNRGSNNGPDNGFYTQEQLKEIIAYAAERNVEIIPELDIPGHSVAILCAHPELGCSFRHQEQKTLGTTTNMMLCANNEDAYKIYEDIIAEVATLFPSKKIHLGGDEAAVKENWAKCSDCLSLMQRNGYQEPSQLMNIFFGRMLDIVRRNGKEAILWCELDNIYPPAHDYLFPYPQDVTLVTWRNGLTPTCIELTRTHGHTLIMAPGEYTYLDYPQWHGDLPEFNNWGMPISSLENCYKFDPSYGLPTAEQSHIAGVMATLWSEAIKDINRTMYMFFPRGLAIAEAGWSNMEVRSWERFKERLYPTVCELMKSGVAVRAPFEIAPRK